MKLCSECGNKNDADLGQTACFRCGAPLPEESLADEPLTQPSVSHIKQQHSDDIQSSQNGNDGGGVLAVILTAAFYTYVAIVGVVVSVLSPSEWFDDWSTTRISQGVDSFGRSYTETKYAIWESLSSGEQFIVVMSVAIILLGLPMLSLHLKRKGWRISTASLAGCVIAIGVLFGFCGISYLVYMARSCFTDAWFHIAKIAFVGTISALPILLLDWNRQTSKTKILTQSPNTCPPNRGKASDDYDA